MSKEEIMTLDLEALEARSLEISNEGATAPEERLAELEKELDAIRERKQQIITEAEEKRAAMAAVLGGEGTVIEKAREERKTMTSREIRNTEAYINAYVDYIKGNSDGTECRALLTTNADLGSDQTGTIEVPTYIEDRINTAWENDEIMRRVRRTFIKGNLKVGYEASSDGAKIHEEGANAIAEENLVINYVELIPKMVKKLVRISDEVFDLKGTAFLDYIYDEMEYQIIKLVATNVVGAIIASPLTATSEAQGTIADFIAAEGKLGGEASNVVAIMPRSTYAHYRTAALTANYPADPFDGMPVLFCDQTALGDNAFVIADLSAVQANFPDGDQVKFKFDDLTEADSDIIRIIGRLYVALGVVAPGKTVMGVEGETSK